MTDSIVVQAGQNIADIAIQEYGSIDALLPLCLENNLELGAGVEPGKELLISNKNVIDKKIIEYYNRKKHKPASGGVLRVWILDTGFWDDAGVWVDADFWKDGE